MEFYVKCPRCKHSEVRFSHRNILEKGMSLVFPLRPYRCKRCDVRFYSLARPLMSRKRATVLSLLCLVGIYQITVHFLL